MQCAWVQFAGVRLRYAARPRYVFPRLGSAAQLDMLTKDTKIVTHLLSTSACITGQSSSISGMGTKYTYLHGKPESFVNSCDVLLKLDDGSKLPAHSLFLASHSRVCADMLDGGPLSAASALNKIELPLTDCSKDTAISLLKVLYSYQPVK